MSDVPISARLSLRLGLGQRCAELGKRPERPLELYEFESCPFCRKAREAVSALDLETRIYPCPKGGTRYRPRATALAGRASFPTLVDPNVDDRDRVLQESDRIVEVLFQRYGRGVAPWLLRSGLVGNALSGFTSGGRSGRGGRRRPSAVDASDFQEPALVLYAYEGQAAARPVKETLTELELTYLWRPDAAGSTRASAESPRLIDETAGRTLIGASAITSYLESTYGSAR